MQKWIILFVVFIILILTTIIVLNVDIETEYTPETEIAETELRKTIITLYFLDKNTGELAKESRLVDSKELIIKPYEEVLNMLISGPENGNYERIIPENTRILETSLEGDCLIINFGSEISESIADSTSQSRITESIYQSLKEFTEINSIKILVGGQEIQENMPETIENSEV